MRDFKKWFAGMTDSIATFDYYVDFQKVLNNVDKVRFELHLFDALIGADNIEETFREMIKKYPETIKCIPILLAVRESEIYARTLDEGKSTLYKFNELSNGVDDYVRFMKETGLFDLLKNKKILSVSDYVTGVEVGLDSNARKNRGGHLMENLVQSYIEKAGFVLGENYFKEMYISEIKEKWGLDLSAISNEGKTEKRFDYVIKTDDMIYGIEVNFYQSGGSKLNETARSYKTIAMESKQIEGFTFIWFTDGAGWQSARHNLEETWDTMDTIFNIDDLDTGIIEKLK